MTLFSEIRKFLTLSLFFIFTLVTLATIQNAHFITGEFPQITQTKVINK